MIRTSRRLPWDAAANPHARLLDERRRAGAALLDLATSNPTAVGLPCPKAEIARALADPRAAAYRPDPRGLVEARRAVAARYAERGLAVDAADLLLTASTSEAYALLFKLLCDPGDAVLVPRPSYPLLAFLGVLEGVEPVPYALGFDGGFHLDLAALQHALDGCHGRARAIVVVSPNNPTGDVLDEPTRRGLADLAARAGVAVICDEVFADYPLDAGAGASLVEERGAVCFTLDGLSKSLGLPQLKLAWIHTAGPDAERRRLGERLELVADTYLSVGAPVQWALPSLLALRPALAGAISARCRANLDRLRRATAGTACTVLPAAAGWSACVRVPAVKSDEDWALQLLRDDGVVVQPGYFYDFPEPLCVLVASLLTDEETFAAGVARLVARCGEPL